MKKLTIAFLYNVRHKYPNSNDPRTFLEADFDDPPTIKMMISHFRKAGFELIPIEADERAYLKLYRERKKIDLAFNYSEGIYGRCRESQIPAMLEMLQIPHTGSSPLTQALVLDKAKTKEILATYGIPVLPHQVLKNSNEKIKKDLKFPLIVKPVAQGSSAGITNSSVVFNINALKRQVRLVNKTFKQPALIEPFLTGREFSVSLLGNPPKILPIVESDHGKLPSKFQPLDSLEVKWHYEEQTGSNYLICPAKIEKNLKRKIEKIALETWQALEIFDYCRMDIRCDQKGNPSVLEVNSPAGLIPPEISVTSSFPLSARVAGISYEDLLKEIINLARTRKRNLREK